MSEPLKTVDEIDILMREYAALRSEIVENIRHWQAHARYSGIILGIVVAIITLAAKSESGVALAHSRLFWFFIGMVVTTFIAYFAFDALEAQYGLFAIASRASTIEDQVNTSAGKGSYVGKQTFVSLLVAAK
jgi:hypothetical protein